MRKKSLIQKTVHIGGTTFLSRILGLIREILKARYMGVSALSDAFFTAYAIPNFFRKIFAEGALSAVMVPTLVAIKRERGKEGVSSLVTLALLFFESLVLVLCVLFIVYAPSVIHWIMPGWSAEQVARAVPFLKILMPFLFFISTSALFAAALQSVGHFFVPAFAPVLLNIVFIMSLFICWQYQLPADYLCWFILFGGFLQFLFHCSAYVRHNFTFFIKDSRVWRDFGAVLLKFAPCCCAMAIVEISLQIDRGFASYLPAGSPSLLYYGIRFMGIPLGVFGVAFSTILLPHFSRVAAYAPKRLSFYLLEGAKLVFWVTIPITIIMAFFSRDIFVTLFLSKKFTLAQTEHAAYILTAYLVGLFAFSFNKIVTNMFYALHNAWLPMVVTFVTTGVNIALNIPFMHLYGATGLALATSIGACVQTGLLIGLLVYRYKFTVYIREYYVFIARYMVQLFTILPTCGLLYYFIRKGMMFLPQPYAYILLRHIGLWLWVGPLVGLFFWCMYETRKFFRVKMYFLD